MASGALGWRGVAVSLSTWCALACGASTRSDPAPGKVEGGGAPSHEPMPAAGQTVDDGGVAAELAQTNGVVTGTGCVVGLPTPTSGSAEYCGLLSGKIEGARVTFGYDAIIASEGADLWVSSDGQRMAGRHAFNGEWFAPVAWLRIQATDAHLPKSPELEPVASVLAARLGSWVLTQLEGPEPNFLGRSDLGVVFNIQRDRVLGTLGAFWLSEMRWSEADNVLEVGPVPETVPGLPVHLSLHFEASLLQSVEATLPSGQRQRFSATDAP